MAPASTGVRIGVALLIAATVLGAAMLFLPHSSTSRISIIGGADGPTTTYIETPATWGPRAILGAVGGMFGLGLIVIATSILVRDRTVVSTDEKPPQ